MIILEISFGENIIKMFWWRQYNNVLKMLDFNVISTLKSDVKTTLKFDDIIIFEKNKI